MHHANTCLMTKVTITKAPDENTTVEITYYYMDGTLWLDRYEVATRATKRHKYVVQARYDRLNSRVSTIKDPRDILDLPDEETVKAAYLKELSSKLQVKLWTDK
jgi:hypothetical protein